MTQLAPNSKLIQAIPAQAATATVTGAALDLSGYDRALVTLNVGTMTGTSPTLDVKVQSSATSGGTYADITGAAFAQVTTTNDVAAYMGEIRINAAKPFLKVISTIAGTTPSVPHSVDIHAYETSLLRQIAAPVFDVAA